MNKTEFLAKLEETLQGEVSQRVSQENLNYYNNYITQEVSAGQIEEQVIAAIGDPRLIARTIIDSSEAAGDTPDQGGYTSSGDGHRYDNTQGNRPRNSSSGSWAGKAMVIGVVFLVVFIIFSIVGGIFSLLFRFAGPIIILAMVFWFIKSMRR